MRLRGGWVCLSRCRQSDAEDDDSEPELGGTLSADFQCEMGHKLTIWKNETDDKHIAIRWDKRIHRLTRVETTTGANRFENRKMGLVWIGIPAKGLLLDSKKGQQLANECKNADQIKPPLLHRQHRQPRSLRRLTRTEPGRLTFPTGRIRNKESKNQRITESGSTPQFTIAAQTGFD